MMKRAVNRLTVYMIAFAVLAAVCSCRKKASPGDQPDRVYEVVRGNFNVVISASGTLDPIKNYAVEAPPVSGQGLDIIEAVKDQSVLKEGDLIVAFSDENYLNEMEAQEIRIEEAEKNLMLVQQDYQMKIADSVSLIKKATDAHRVSREALKKYMNEDAPLAKQDAQQTLAAARQAVANEEKNLAELNAELLTAAMGDMAARDKIQTEVDSSQAELDRLMMKEARAQYDLRIFKQYTFPQKSRGFKQDVVKAQLDLQKQLVDAAAQRVQLERKIETQERTLRSLRKQRDDLEANILMLRVTAPVAGVLTYGNPDPRRRSMQQKDIVVGTAMRPSELIGTIPDLSQMIVNVDIPEVVRSKVQVGMRAEMRIKALSGVRLSGAVSRISDLASNLIYWDRSSPKIYPTVISLDQNLPALRPGMTVEIDLISEEVRNVLYVPVEALTVKEGQIYCRVKKVTGFEERLVTIGKSSSSFVEIVSGLNEGERVLLTREELAN